MSVKLIALTKPVIPGLDTPEQLLAYCARVSSSSNQLNHATGPKLLGYMMEHQEWSPFEMVNLTMEIETTRDIGRQILRHRSFSFQEFSQRYAEVSDEFVKSECRMQDRKNRQSSLDCNSEEIRGEWDKYQEDVWWTAIERYEKALEMGVAKEVARKLLPEGLTPTRMYMQGSLRSWYHYCKLRMSPATQREHQVIASDAWDIVIQQFPTLM